MPKTGFAPIVPRIRGSYVGCMKAINSNLNGKLPRIIAATFVGSILWAGCAAGPAPTVRYAGEVGPTSIDRESFARAPIDMTNRRPDTNPHIRTGLWDFTYRHNGPMEDTYVVIEAPGQERELPPGYADTTALLAFNPEVLNAAVAFAEPSPGDLITEAAGAAPDQVPAIVREVEDYMDELAWKTEQRFGLRSQPQP
jgi:hypothetical protein